ncbi:MAG: threonine/serine dehydratase [Candidatus Solibacter sp.]
MKEEIVAAAARIAPFVRVSPVEYASEIGAYLKLEHLQHTGSFKFRGASNKIALLTPEEAAAGVVTASNGNHGLGVAAAAQARGIAAEVFVSTQVSQAKAQRIEAAGGSLHYAGDDPLAAELAARGAAAQSGRVFISPYNDRDVMAGQGTIAVELAQQLPEVDAVFVAVGGGGLIGGIGSYFKAVAPRVEIVGCWPENSPVMLRCMEAGEIVEVPELPTVSESTAGGLEPGSVTLDVCRRVIDRAVLVSEREIVSAMRKVFETEHWVIEGAAGVAVAAFLQEADRWRGKRAAVIVCGRNVSPRVLHSLRF